MRAPSNLGRAGLGFNMTPMIDVVFLLIIFFLVSSHLAKQEPMLPLPLPEADSGSQAVDDESPRLIVHVLREGRILLDGNRIDPEQLQRRFQSERARFARNLEVRIRGDRNVAYRHVEPVLLAAAGADIWNVTFAVIKREDAE